jgi:Xaa-Pro dipeptidase
MNRAAHRTFVVNTLTSGFPGKLKEGMVIALEPKCIFPGQGVVGLEDDYLVTSSGLERLTLTDQTIMTIE